MNHNRLCLNKMAYLTEIIVIILLASVAIILNQRMIRDGVIFESNDLKYHLTWLQYFYQQLTEGIIYPRWLAGDNYGYGSPTFVFYPPLIYYLGSLFKVSGLDTENTIISLFSLAIFLAGFNFYYSNRDRSGNIAALSGALFYMTTPYLALNIYLRGALAELWSLVWIPWGFWLTNKAMMQSKWRFTLAFLAALVALTHIPSLLLFTIFWLIYALSFMLTQPIKIVLKTIISVFLGFGLVAFYLVPAILEKSWVNIEFMRFKDGYKLHLFSFGITKVAKIVDKFVQPIFIYDLVIILVLITLIILGLKSKEIWQQTRYWIFFIIVIAFLMLYPSLFLWQSSKTLQMVQFPWRLLGLFSFGIASLITVITNKIIHSQQPKKFILLTIISILLLNNIYYSYQLSLNLAGFHNPRNIAALKTNRSWKASIYEQIKTAIDDPYANKLKGTNEYRPLINDHQAAPPPILGQPPVSLTNGKAEINLKHWGSYERSLSVTATAISTIKFRTYYYPAWHLYVNDSTHEINIAKDGTMEVKLNPGTYNLQLIYQWTNAFKLGLFLSIFSLITLILLNSNLSKI